MSFLIAARLLGRRQIFAGFQPIFTAPRCSSGKASATCNEQKSQKTQNCIQEIDARPGENYDDKNARLHRPLSPHLSIYSPQICSMLSITHRVTGTVGGVYMWMFAGGAVFLPFSFDDGCNFLECVDLGAVLLTLMKFVVAFPYIYHSVNGIRHLVWDTGNCLSNSQVFATGMVMLAVVAAITGTVLFAL